MRHLHGIAAALLLGMVALPGAAQAPGAKVATVTAVASPATVARGGYGTLRITVAIAPHFHINANKPNDTSLIPTKFTSAPMIGIHYGAPHFPAAKSIKVSYEKRPMQVYTGKAVITVPYTVARTARRGRTALTGTIGYQGCNATSCYPPHSAPVKAVVTIK